VHVDDFDISPSKIAKTVMIDRGIEKAIWRKGGLLTNGCYLLAY